MAAVQKVEFSQAVLLGFGRTLKGGNARFTCALTDALRRKLGIEDLPDHLSEGKASEVELAATSMMLKSRAGDLAEYEIQIDAQRAHHFELVKRESENSRGKSKRTEVRFMVSFADTKGCAFLEEYITKAGDSKGTLTLSYTERAQQDSLLEDEEETQQRVMES